MNRRFQVAVIWVILTGAATYLFLFDPVRGGYPSCPFRMLTGLQCPGCGTARGLHQLLHGHPITAFELNPLVILSLPLLAFVLLSLTGSALKGNLGQNRFIPGQERFSSPRYGWILFGVIISFWIFRNTPIYPFTV